MFVGGQIGHRKYDCPEQRNFTANIICRSCGNSGHISRDCPERQRGTDPRNFPGGVNPTQGRIGGGDAVDREMEQLMQELGGNPSAEGLPARIEAAPRGYEDGGDYGGQREPKPWERGPTGAAAPWQRSREDRGDNYGGSGSAPWANRGGDSYGGYGGPPGGAAPWQQPPPPPPGGQQNYGYGYSGSGYDQQNLGAPPGLPQMLQNYGNAPPPPPGSAPPPPPPGDYPPPPVSHKRVKTSRGRY